MASTLPSNWMHPTKRSSSFGYGIAAFGVGPLRHAGLSLPDLYAASAGVAVVLGGLSFAVAHRRPSPASLHPRPLPQQAAGQPQLGASGSAMR